MPKGSSFGRKVILKKAPQSHTQITPPRINLHVRARKQSADIQVG